LLINFTVQVWGPSQSAGSQGCNAQSVPLNTESKRQHIWLFCSIYNFRTAKKFLHVFWWNMQSWSTVSLQWHIKTKWNTQRL